MLWDFGRKKDAGGAEYKKLAAVAGAKDSGKKSKAVLDSLRDDALAFRLSRSLFK